jgi:hypothetical protein
MSHAMMTPQVFVISLITILVVVMMMRRRWTVMIWTRYDYNLTIMKSPKPATDNRFKK